MVEDPKPYALYNLIDMDTDGLDTHHINFFNAPQKEKKSILMKLETKEKVMETSIGTYKIQNLYPMSSIKYLG